MVHPESLSDHMYRSEKNRRIGRGCPPERSHSRKLLILCSLASCRSHASFASSELEGAEHMLRIALDELIASPLDRGTHTSVVAAGSILSEPPEVVLTLCS